MLPFRRTAALLLAASLVLGACGDDPPPKPKGGPKGTGTGTGGIALGKVMPEFTPSGIKEDYVKYRELKEASTRPATKEDERAAAKKALADLVATLAEKWAGKEVPAPEALMYGSILKQAGKNVEAVVQIRRYLDVCPPDSNNFLNATTQLIVCLAASGDFDGAAAHLAKEVDGCYRGRDRERQDAGTTIAMSMMEAGQLEKAADQFETLTTLGSGDAESAILGVDCWLRVGNLDAARRIAQKGVDFFKEGRQGARMQELLAEVDLVGKPSPGFAAARDWKGTGGPITPDMMTGKVVVVFTFNLQTQWLRFFMKRINAMYEELAPKGVILVGMARLAHFDPMKMGVRKEMTEEEELEFFDRWAQQEGVKFPLVLGGYDSDTTLLSAWAALNIPTCIVVGKDGKVSYIRTGKEDGHVAILKEMVEKALAK